MSNGNNFGYIYDWMETQDVSDEYTQYQGGEGKEELLVKMYDEMTAGMENPMDYLQWKQTYGKYIETYNPAQEELTQEAFDIKYEQTEKLFDLKTTQKERDYALIEKYTAIDDSDDFESSTELSIRHSEESDEIDKKINRLKLISEGKTLNQKKKIIQDESLISSIRTGDTDRIVSELDKTFWNDMKVVRAEYDKKRLNKNQALDALILKADQTVESAFKSKEDSLETLLVSSEGNLKNAAVDLIGDKIQYAEEYNEEAWDTMGELAAGDAFLDTCNPICTSEEFCFRGICYPKKPSMFNPLVIDETTAGFDEIKDHWKLDDGTVPEIMCINPEDATPDAATQCLPTDQYNQQLFDNANQVLEALSDWSHVDLMCNLAGCPWGCGGTKGC